MGEIDVGLVEDDNAVPGWVGEDLLHVDLEEEGARSKYIIIRKLIILIIMFIN